MRENLGSTPLSSTPHFVLAQKKENDLGVAPARSPPPPPRFPPFCRFMGKEPLKTSRPPKWKCGNLKGGKPSLCLRSVRRRLSDGGRWRGTCGEKCTRPLWMGEGGVRGQRSWWVGGWRTEGELGGRRRSTCVRA